MELGVWHIVCAVTAVVFVWSFVTHLLWITILIIALTVVIIAAYGILRKPRAEDLMTGMRWPDDKGALRRNNIRMAVVLVAAVLVTAGTLVLVRDYIYDSESWIDHSYSVSIDALTTDAYTVMCPVPCDDDGTVYEGFLDELEVADGTAVIALLDTEHGRALRVQGQGDLELIWSASWSVDGEWFRNMTMTEEYDGSAQVFDTSEEVTATSWVYSDRSGVTVNLHFSAMRNEVTDPRISSIGGPEYGFTAEVESVGWDLAGVEYFWEYSS